MPNSGGGGVIDFEPGFGSSVGEWKSAEWRAYRTRVESLMDSPDVVGAAGGEIRVPFVRDEGDWPRVEADWGLLRPLVEAYGPTRFGGALLRDAEPEVGLLRALSVVGGWDLVWMWRDLLSRLELELGRAKARDADVAEKAGLAGKRGTSAKLVAAAGITWAGVWQAALDEWWAASGRPGEWGVGMSPVSALAWTELPEEVTLGPAVVRWLDPWTEQWQFSALVNGVLRDSSPAAYGGLVFFFHTLTVGV